MGALRGKCAVLVLALIGCLVCLPASAQMYRCGNVYQDRPCEGAQPGKTVPGVAAKAKAADAPSTASPGTALRQVCAQRGIDSQKIVWSREGGATEEKLLSEEPDPGRKRLISDVYRARGSAPQVRARIEAECQTEMAEKEKALALHEALVKAGALPGKGSTPAARTAEELDAEAKRLAQQQEQKDAAAKKRRCDSLSAEVDSIRDRQLRGGDSVYMDNLNRQRVNVDAQRRKAGC